jgi:hypothetical protein
MMQSEKFTLEHPTLGPISTYRQRLIGLLLPASPCVKILKSASAKFFITVYQLLARGLFKRVDGVIACTEETADLGYLYICPKQRACCPRASLFNDQQRLNYNLTTT